MTTILPEGYDFTDPFLNEKAIPHDDFRKCRESAPVTWIEQQKGAYDGVSEESGQGYFAVTKHADVSDISKNSKDWSNSENGAIIRFQEGMLREQIEMQRRSCSTRTTLTTGPPARSSPVVSRPGRSTTSRRS